MDYVTALITSFIGCCFYGYLSHIAPNVNWGAAGAARKYVRALNSSVFFGFFFTSLCVCVYTHPPQETRAVCEFCSVENAVADM